MPTPIDLIVTRLQGLQPMTAVEQLMLRVRLAMLFALDKDEHGYGSYPRGGTGGTKDTTSDAERAANIAKAAAVRGPALQAVWEHLGKQIKTDVRATKADVGQRAAWDQRLATKAAEDAHHAQIGKAINALIEEHGVDWLGALNKMPAHERARRGLPQAA